MEAPLSSLLYDSMAMIHLVWVDVTHWKILYVAYRAVNEEHESQYILNCSEKTVNHVLIKK